MLPKPQSRLEVLLNKIATNTMNDLPIPQSRLELLVSALITNDIDNLPSPQSRSEAILHCILLDTECNISPQSRVELFLKSIITLDIEGLPTPMGRLEWYLDYIVRNGCLEKYEYYPFTIRDYLNVKNTPKAKMRFKGMKGNTLVNEVIDNTLEISRPKTKQIKPNTTYTVFVKKVSGTGQFNLAYFNQDIRKFGDFGVIFQVHTENIVYIKKVTTPSDACFFGFYIANGDIKVTDVIILEGDYTQNPPPYFEGMKSFGDGPNKIEVLSVGRNLINPDKLIYGLFRYDDNSLEYRESNHIMYKDYIKVSPNTSYNAFDDFTVITYLDRNKNHIGQKIGSNTFTTPSNCYFIKARTLDEHSGLLDYYKQNCYLSTNKEYQPYQSSKAIPMYRNANNELVPVPVLRGKCDGDRFLWGDEILLHDDGKLYYHKRCGMYDTSLIVLEGIYGLGDKTKGVYTSTYTIHSSSVNPWDVYGFICDKAAEKPHDHQYDENKFLDSEFFSVSNDGRVAIRVDKSKGSDINQIQEFLRRNIYTIVYRLSEEEVYPCELSEQLYSYDNETNIFINGGVVVGETVIEVGTKLGPIVAEIKQETLRNARAVEGLLAHGVQEMAYQLYPEDFNKSIETVPVESV